LTAPARGARAAPNGSERIRSPVAANHALHSAGATSGTATSPMPPGGASLAKSSTTICGISFARSTR